MTVKNMVTVTENSITRNKKQVFCMRKVQKMSDLYGHMAYYSLSTCQRHSCSSVGNGSGSSIQTVSSDSINEWF